MPPCARKSRSSECTAARKLSIHGLAVEIDCQVSGLNPTIGRLLGSFDAGEFPARSPVSRGSVVPYLGTEVARRLPSSAVPLHAPGDLTEIYVQDERAWVFDERWGMSEINHLKAQWKSWIVPQPRLDTVRLTELSVLRPLAMLLKNRGLHLLPAAAAARDGFALLAISPFGLERELAALLDARYRIIGQRWTALREDEGRLTLLGMPGVVQQRPAGIGMKGDWIDLTASNPLSTQQQAVCSAVMIIDAGRRSRATMSPWSPADAATVLRLAWPLPELHPNRRRAALASRIAQICPCHRVRLSHEPREWLSLLESLRSAATPLRKAA
jgi:hypothetical protein